MSIYFIQVGTDGPIKIGFAKYDVRRRVRALQLASPHILRWIGFFPGTLTDEKLAHRLLKSSSLRGEWFYPTVEVMAFIGDKSPNFEPVIVDNSLDQLRLRSPESRRRTSVAMIRSWGERRTRDALNSLTPSKNETTSWGISKGQNGIFHQ